MEQKLEKPVELDAWVQAFDYLINSKRVTELI